MTTESFPCENCICLPMCRHKSYTDLLLECALLRSCTNTEIKTIGDATYITIDIISQSSNHFKRALHDQLNPTRWKVDSEGVFSEGAHND